MPVQVRPPAFLFSHTGEGVLCGCFDIRGHGGIGRRARFRFWCPRRAGSSPVARIKKRCIVMIHGDAAFFLCAGFPIVLTEFTISEQAYVPLYTDGTISFVNIGLYGTAEMTTVLSYDKKCAIMSGVVWNISEE